MIRQRVHAGLKRAVEATVASHIDRQDGWETARYSFAGQSCPRLFQQMCGNHSGRPAFRSPSPYLAQSSVPRNG